MKKIYWIWLGIILLIGLVTAGAILLSNVDFTVPEKEPIIRYLGCITFTIDGKDSGECCLDEPNLLIDDDFEECLEDNFAGKRITNARDWTGREYKQREINGTIYRSFDEDYLNRLIAKAEE